MGKSTHFSGQPLYGQVIKLLDKSKIFQISRENGGERYTKLSRKSTANCTADTGIFKGVGRHPKTGKKKGGIKVHTVIHANEGVPSDMKFTSAATNDSFMLKPATLNKGDIMAMDRAYIDYEKFEQLSERGVVYVTKMKKSLKYKILKDTAYQTSDGLTEVRVQEVVFTKYKSG